MNVGASLVMPVPAASATNTICAVQLRWRFMPFIDSPLTPPAGDADDPPPLTIPTGALVLLAFASIFKLIVVPVDGFTSLDCPALVEDALPGLAVTNAGCVLPPATVESGASVTNGSGNGLSSAGAAVAALAFVETSCSSAEKSGYF
jgi:hypothetical protein